jgi:pyruvate ferredoxin oxidoreductase alpha subunit
MSGTAVYTVDQMRAEGHKVGAVKIVSFRPFPYRLLQERLSHIPRIAVLERATSIGSAGGPVLCEVRSALANVPVAISGFVAGLGGRDITPTTFKKVFDLLRTAAPETLPTWVDVRENAMTIREFVLDREVLV